MKKADYSKMVEEVAERMIRHADVLMTVKQVAEYLGISEDAVRKRCQRKQLPYHTKNRRLYFSKNEIDNALLERK